MQPGTRVGVPGVFKICDTHGFPLEDAILKIHDSGMVVAWDEYVRDAVAHGWKRATIRKKILGAVQEAMGQEFAVHVSERLDRILTWN